MPLGKGIVGMLSAVQERIEVSGQTPTWRVTGASFDQALAYAREAWDDPVVLARESSGRWWPRVTITVTTDPLVAATAPSLEDLAAMEDRLLPRQRGSAEVLVVPEAPGPEPAVPARPSADFSSGLLVTLDEIFEHQEALRVSRGVPQQRSSADGRG